MWSDSDRERFMSVVVVVILNGELDKAWNTAEVRKSFAEWFLITDILHEGGTSILNQRKVLRERKEEAMVRFADPIE